MWMAVKFKGQRQWIRETLDRWEDVEKLRPDMFLGADDEWPEWVANLFGLLVGVSHPGLKVKNVQKWKAKDLGRLLGRQYALEQLVFGEVPLSPTVAKEAVVALSGMEKHAMKRNPGLNLEEVLKEIEPEMKAWRPKFKACMQEALASACERPYRESSAFFEAFGKAIVIKPDDLSAERILGVSDKICWTMFVMWKDIERLGSVAELHRLFDRILKPKGIEVSHKRIEKLCQRIKLRFRKGPGRPKGSKNSDKSLRSLRVISQK